MKKFLIKKTLSTAEWKSVSQSAIKKALLKGETDSIPGASEALLEAFAVIAGSEDERKPWGLHHELHDDGSLVLNRAALLKVAAEISKDKGLSNAERRRARQHILGHFREHEIDAPESLTSGEMIALRAKVCGEMAVEDIPLAPGVDLEAIKEGDDDPLEVIVEVPPGYSTRGWNYREAALWDIVNFVQEQTLNGFLGHQDPRKVDWEFLTPVTHWVGAIWQDGKAYFRGVVDKGAPDLKRWIRSGRIRTVSIFGIPQLREQNGETQVIGYEPWSIDWTPLHRAGMPTSIVVMGEMDGFRDSTFGEMDGSHEELQERLNEAATKKLRADGRETWVSLVRTFDTHVIVGIWGNGERNLYDIPYTVEGEEIELGEPVEVEEKREYVPKTKQGGTGEMNIQEVLAALRAAIAKNEIDLTKVVGEIGYTPAQAVEALVGDKLSKAEAGAAFGTKLAQSLGVDKLDSDQAVAMAGEMASVWSKLGYDKQKPEKPVEAVGEMLSLVEGHKTKAHEETISKVIGEQKIEDKSAASIITKMLKANVPVGATEETVKGEMAKLLEDPDIKGMVSRQYIDDPAGVGGSGNSDSHKYVATGKTSI